MLGGYGSTSVSLKREVTNKWALMYICFVDWYLFRLFLKRISVHYWAKLWPWWRFYLPVPLMFAQLYQKHVFSNILASYKKRYNTLCSVYLILHLYRNTSTIGSANTNYTTSRTNNHVIWLVRMVTSSSMLRGLIMDSDW